MTTGCATPSRSGGVILDMHVHDVDAALWWFGKPDEHRCRRYLPPRRSARCGRCDLDKYAEWPTRQPAQRLGRQRPAVPLRLHGRDGAGHDRLRFVGEGTRPTPAHRARRGQDTADRFRVRPIRNEIDDFIAHLMRRNVGRSGNPRAKPRGGRGGRGRNPPGVREKRPIGVNRLVWRLGEGVPPPQPPARFTGRGGVWLRVALQAFA